MVDPTPDTRARALLWRLRRRWQRPPGPLRWTTLASVWVHAGLLGAVLLCAGPALEAPPGSGPLTVHRVPAGTAPGGGGDQDQVGTRARATHALEDGAVGAQVADRAARGRSAPAGLRGSAEAEAPATAAAPDDPEPLASLELEPAPDEPERRGRVEPPESADDDDPPREEPEEWLRFARTEAEQATEEAPEEWLAISAHHSRTDRPRRAPVTSQRHGPLKPRANGPSDASGSPTLQRHEGVDDPMRGNRDEAEPGHIPIGGGGGGRDGTRRGSGASDPGGARLAGGPAARRAAGSAAPGASAGGAGPTEAAVAPTAPLGRRAPTSASPSWWKPTAVRVVVQREPAPAAPAERGGAPSPSSGRGIALRETVAHSADRGGTDESPPDEAALPTEPAPSTGTHRVAPPGTGDPAEELRAALGWAPIDRSELGPRPAWAGTLGEDGQRDSSPRSPFADVPIDWTTSLNTRGTPLGQWVQRAEEIVGERWQQLDLATHDRAVGIQGRVTVRYVVRPGGRVVDKWVDRSSGHPSLDEMALAAIPDRLPRLPRGERSDSLHHRVTLRYRNPLLPTGAPGP